MGSLIAVQIAHDRPELVRAAVVTGTCVRKTGFNREWEQAEINFRREGGTLPPAFATAHYAMQYFPADALGDDAMWEQLKPLVTAGFAERTGRCWRRSGRPAWTTTRGRCCRRSPRRSTRWPSPRTCRRRPQRVREVAELAADGHFHLLPGLGHGSAFGHRPQEVNECLRAIIDQECDGS